MKVIIIKKCKDGNINDIVDVSDGYAKNYLIKNGIALPINAATQRKLSQNLEKIKKQKESDLAWALKLKEGLTNTILEFNLGVTNDVVHGSITNKQILKQFKEKGFLTINKYNLDHNSIASIGITKIRVKLHKDIIATVKIKVEKNG